ncbi:LOW QUALITY PROTEIN: relaxin receptor 2 [Eudromia elegans]
MLIRSIRENSGWASIFGVVHGKPDYLDLAEECYKSLQHNCIQTVSRKAFFGLYKLQKLMPQRDVGSTECFRTLVPDLRQGLLECSYCQSSISLSKLWNLILKEKLPCYITGFNAMLSTEVLLITYLTLEKYLVIVFPFSNTHPGGQKTRVILTAIIVGFFIVIIPFWNEDFFGNYYGENCICYPMNSDPIEELEAMGIFLVFFLVGRCCCTQNTARQTLGVRSHRHRDAAVVNPLFLGVFADAICWILVFVIQILSVISLIVILVLPTNNALNPALCTLTSYFL